MPRRPPVAAGLLGLLVLAGCVSSSGAGTKGSGDVPVAAVNGLSPGTLIACRSFKLAVPHELAAGVAQRSAAPLSDSTIAWGDPAVTSRCGVPSGSTLDGPYTFNGVQWAMHDNGASRIWTTLHRKVNVAVEVPDAYGSQAELIGVLAPAVEQQLR